MNIPRLYITLAIGAAAISLILATVCPQKCSCEDDDTYFQCYDLTEIPPLKTADSNTIITFIYFGTGHINNIPANSLPAGLKMLTFHGNPLTNISRDAFASSSSTLYALTIEQAEFTKLPDALLKLAVLGIFRITDTPIAEWDPVILQHLGTTVYKMTLQNVSLTGWPSWFSLFSMLRAIDVSGNALKSIPDDAFAFVNWDSPELYLANCQLTAIPTKALSALKAVKILDLSGNNLLEINENSGINHVEELRLNSIGLTLFPDLSSLNSLRDLYLENNHLSDIAKERLPPHINSLHLSGNNFHRLPDFHSEVSSLSFLDLENNQISEVNFDLLNPSIYSLSLYINKITTISEPTLNGSLQLKDLDLRSNPLSVIPSSAFRRLEHLNSLYLSYTQLTQIPSALASLTNLEYLGLYNPSVDCSCPLPSVLSKWYQSRSQSLTVDGSCNGFGEIRDYLRGSCHTKSD